MGTMLLLVSALVFAQEHEDQCIHCHVEPPHLSGGEACQTCHGAEFDPSHGKKRVVLDQPLFKANKSSVASTNLLPPGMSVPMYYPKSRLGDAPNEMIVIPAGDFIRGTNDRLADEGPEHVVHLDEYFIDKFEVTNLQYKRYIDDVGRRAPEHFDERQVPEGKADHPVTFVSWKNAQTYCQWAGKRLPTDQEWEKAARGLDARTFPWGNEFEMHNANTPVRWETLGEEGDTSPVGAFAAGKSPYGLYDVSGNVWEWTDAWYMAYPNNMRQTENYGKKYRTLKGGSWWDCSFYKCGISAPVYNRSFFNPKVKNSSFGFRCAKDA